MKEVILQGKSKEHKGENIETAFSAVNHLKQSESKVSRGNINGANMKMAFEPCIII